MALQAVWRANGKDAAFSILPVLRPCWPPNGMALSAGGFHSIMDVDP